MTSPCLSPSFQKAELPQPDSQLSCASAKRSPGSALPTGGSRGSRAGEQPPCMGGIGGTRLSRCKCSPFSQLSKQVLVRVTAHTGNEAREGTPGVLHRMRARNYVQGWGTQVRCTPRATHSIRRSNCSAAANSAFMAAAHSSSSDFWGKRKWQVRGAEKSLGRGTRDTQDLSPSPAHQPLLTRTPKTFFFFRFSRAATGGEMPGSAVLGSQGTSDASDASDASVVLGHTTGDTLVSSSVLSSSSKPKQEGRPAAGVEVVAKLVALGVPGRL